MFVPGMASGADPPFRALSPTDQIAAVFMGTADERQIFVTNAAGGTTAFVTPPGSTRAGSFAWSPGAGTLAARIGCGTGRPAQEGVADMFGQVLPLALSLEVLAVMLAAFLAGSIWIFSTREYVMEQ